MHILNLQWRKACIAGLIGLLTSGALFGVFWYVLSISCFNPTGCSSPSLWENIVVVGLFSLSLCLGCAALAWILGFRIVRTAAIGLAMHIIIPLLTRFLALPYSIGGEYVHLPFLSSLSLTILAGSWGSPNSTVSSRIATIAITIALAFPYTLTPFLPFGFLVAWTIIPATYALFTTHDYAGPEKKELHASEKSIIKEKQ